MESPNYPSNNNEDREIRVQRVTQNKVRVRRDTLGRRIAESFTGQDSRTVGSYLLFDVVIPALKDMISDATRAGVDRMLFGESRRGYSRDRGRSGYVDYSSSSRRSDPRGRAGEADERRISDRGRKNHDFREIILRDRGDAETILSSLYEVLEEYDQVRVSDLYDLVGISGSYTDDRYGWTNLQGSRVERENDGFVISLPPTEVLR